MARWKITYSTEEDVEAAAGTSTEGDWEVGARFSIAVMG